jgi:hypothetical protein
MRAGDPANVTRAPRATSASATASAGSTCPAVPPAAIRHAGADRCGIVARDVKEDAHRRKRDHEARAAGGDERQRDTRQRSKPEDGREIDQRLAADERRQPGRQQLAERVSAREGHAEAGIAERGKRADHGDRSDEAELLADDGEDHVRVRLGEVEELEHALAEADSEDPAGAHPDHRLDRLEARPLCIAPRV